ncbi:MAG: hypothetical protein ACOZAA_04550 [Pseudomonadota bacterium]
MKSTWRLWVLGALLVSACASGGGAEDEVAVAAAGDSPAPESARGERVDCATAFDEAVPLKTVPFPRGPYPSHWLYPARVEEVEGPLDLDGDGALEKIFIGTIFPQGGMLEHKASTLVIITQASSLFESIDGNGLQAIFSRQMSQFTPGESIPGVERLSFSWFLSQFELVPDGKKRTQSWSASDYATYFVQQSLIADQTEPVPQLAETRVSVVSYGAEHFLLLEVTRDDVRPANEIITNYRFMARYRGKHKLQLVCGERVI